MSSFCKCKSYQHFFSKNINVDAIFNDQSFNNTLTNDIVTSLTNDIVSFEQLGPDLLGATPCTYMNSIDPDGYASTGSSNQGLLLVNNFYYSNCPKISNTSVPYYIFCKVSILCIYFKTLSGKVNNGNLGCLKGKQWKSWLFD